MLSVINKICRILGLTQPLFVMVDAFYYVNFDAREVFGIFIIA